MEEWKEVRLDSLVNRKICYGIVQPGFSPKNGIPVIKVNNIVKGLRDISECDKTTEEINNKYKRTILKGGELVISLVGTVGYVDIVPYSFAGANLVRATGMIDIEDELIKHWVLFYIRTSQGQQYIEENLNTTVQRALNIKDLCKMPIPITNRRYMEKVVTILKSLDDKIEVNRKINENLEQQAQALFKSWFVDFEPFKNGEFVESELGMIPKGWRVGKLGDLLEIKYGKDHKKLSDGKIPVYGSGGLMRRVDKSLYKGESVLIPRKGSLNNVMYVNEEFWTVDTMFYTIPKVEHIALFCYLFLLGKDLASMNAGSAVPSMTTEILNSMPVVIPQNSIVNEFDNVISSYFRKIENNDNESRRLASLRDTLLPKLMSGELKVSDVD